MLSDSRIVPLSYNPTVLDCHIILPTVPYCCNKERMVVRQHDSCCPTVLLEECKTFWGEPELAALDVFQRQ